MFKNIFSIIFIFLVSSLGAIYSQTRADTSGTNEDTVTIQVDSSASMLDSSSVASGSAAVELNEDSLYMPVKDSVFLNIYVLRKVSQSKVDKYLAERDYEYANDPEYWKKDTIQNDPGSFSFWKFFRNKAVQWIFLLAVIAVILYGIFLLARENNFKWLSRRSNPVQLGESESVVEQSVNYNDAIRKYQSDGNYRMAIRYMYLRLIHSALEKNIIQFRDSSTNVEIGRSFGPHPLGPEFHYLATAYEYIYFGGFSLNQEIFDGLKERFNVFQQKLSA